MGKILHSGYIEPAGLELRELLHEGDDGMPYRTHLLEVTLPGGVMVGVIIHHETGTIKIDLHNLVLIPMGLSTFENSPTGSDVQDGHVYMKLERLNALLPGH